MNSTASRFNLNDSKAPVKILLGAFLFLGAATIMAKVFSMVLNVSGVPYNVRELFRDHGSFLRIFIFSCAILWTGLSAALITDRVVKSRFPYAVLPFLVGVSGIFSYWLLSAGTTWESISDIVGSPYIWRFVINKHIWGDWGVCLFKAIGSSDLISTIERYVRYLALYCPVSFCIVICSTGLKKSTPKGKFKTFLYFSLISLPWLLLSKIIAFDYFSTDNLIELIATDVAWGMGGGFYLYLLVILITFNSVYISKNLTGPVYKYLLMVVLSFAAVPAGWYLLNTGLVTDFKKYDVAYSGVDFILGPDRKIKLSESILFFRWSVVYLCAVSVLAWGQIAFTLGDTLFKNKKTGPDFSVGKGLSHANLIKIFWIVCVLIAYGSFFPFQFHFDMNYNIQVLKEFLSFNYHSGLSDLVSNFVLFLPFGFFGVKALDHIRYGTGIIVITGILFASILQVIQIFIPARVPSVTDVLWNTAGCVTGGIFANWIRLPTFHDKKHQPVWFSVPVMIASCWLISQLIPFIPSIDLGEIKNSLKPLLIYHEFSWSSCLVYTICWITAGSFVFGTFQLQRSGFYFCLSAGMVLSLQVIIMTRSVSVSNLLGTLLAMTIWILFFDKTVMKTRNLLVVIFAIIFIDGFFPLHVTADPVPFQFVPFHGFLSGNMLHNIITFFEKLFIYGSLVILLRTVLKNHKISMLIACIWVLSIEMLQMFTLNHSPELTDALMVLIIAILIDKIERSRYHAQQTG